MGANINLPKSHKENEAKTEIDMFSALLSSKESEAAEKIRSTDINTMTPIEAMNLLYEVKKMLS